MESVVHAENKLALAQEAYRLLRPNGRLVIAEYLLRASPPLTEDESSHLRPWLHGWAMPELETESSYKEILTTAGFKNIEFHDITAQVLPSLGNLKRLLFLGLPVGRILTALKIFSLEHFGNIKGSAAQIETFERGYWRYMVITAEK